jgi:hypothetical protein
VLVDAPTLEVELALGEVVEEEEEHPAVATRPAATTVTPSQVFLRRM